LREKEKVDDDNEEEEEEEEVTLVGKGVETVRVEEEVAEGFGIICRGLRFLSRRLR
jgi:hypothetical protein